ncbi:MAG: hypothetical protein IPK19_25495 [Chloroflexi bacterium]|nr:hypothetical protein [Chloroflexota bacterium]
MSRILTRGGRLLSLTLALIFLLSAAGLIQAAKPALPAALDADVARAWFSLQLKLVKSTPGFSPPVASRAFGYTGVTLYETVVAGMPEYQPLAGQLNELTALPQPDAAEEIDWGVAANSALAAITRVLFANTTDAGQAEIAALYARFSRQYGLMLDGAVFSRSDAYGREVAAAIYEWSMSDGGHEGYRRSFPSDYVSPTGVGFGCRPRAPAAIRSPRSRRSGGTTGRSRSTLARPACRPRRRIIRRRRSRSSIARPPKCTRAPAR